MKEEKQISESISIHFVCMCVCVYVIQLSRFIKHNIIILLLDIVEKEFCVFGKVKQ